jgi:outer membrane protein assembly factor BamB
MKRNLLLSLIWVIASCSSYERQSGPAPLQMSPEYVENIDPFYRPGSLPIGYATPYMGDDGLYFGTPDGEVKKYDYFKKRSQLINQETAAVFGRPLVQDGILYYGTQGAEIVAFDLNQKKELFRTKVSAPSESSMVIAQNRLFTVLRNHGLISMDAKTGKVLWFYKRSVPTLTTLQRVAVPVIVGQKIYLGFADGFLCALRLEDGSLQWEQKLSVPSKFQDVDFSVVIQGKYVWAAVTGQSVKLMYLENGLIERSFEIAPTSNLLSVGEAEVMVGSSKGHLHLLSSSVADVKEWSISKKPIGSLALWKQQLLAVDFSGKVQTFAKESNGMEFGKIALKSFEMGSQWSSLLGDIEVKNNRFSLISSRNRLYVFE